MIELLLLYLKTLAAKDDMASIRLNSDGSIRLLVGIQFEESLTVQQLNERLKEIANVAISS